MKVITTATTTTTTKIIFILVFILSITTSIINCEFECGKNSCIPTGCISDNDIDKCIENPNEISIKQTVINRWSDNNGLEPKLQVDVRILNNLNFTVVDILIATDANFAFNQYWGVNKNGSILNLPNYVNIKPGDHYNFGYINNGFYPAALFIGKTFILNNTIIDQ